MTNEILQNIVSNIESLPTLPTTYYRINTLMRRPSTCAVDVAEVISKDQVLTARLLKLVNSAFYGLSGKIKTVSGAVVVLGFRSVRSLVLSSSVLDYFRRKNDNPYLDLIRFWKHSLSVAAGSRILARQLDYDDPEEFFVAGLLHDIGKLIQNQYLQSSFLMALEFADHKAIPIYEAEKIKLGVSHCDTGLLLADRWKLPLYIRESIAYHHEPEETPNYMVFSSVVHVANIMARALELGNSGDRVVPALSPAAWRTLNLSVTAIEPAMHKLVDVSRELCEILNLPGETS